MSTHPIVHIEFSTNDTQAGAKFYSELFGWKFEQIPEMNYATFAADGGPGGGLNPAAETLPRGMTIVYVDTEDINASLALVQQLGGKVLQPRSEIPGMGWYAVFTDPTGNMVGLFEDLENTS